MDSVRVCPYSWVCVHAFLSLVAKLLSEQLPRWTNILGGQYRLSNGSKSTFNGHVDFSAYLHQIRTAKSVRTKLMDCTANIKVYNNTHTRWYIWPPPPLPILCCRLWLSIVQWVLLRFEWSFHLLIGLSKMCRIPVTILYLNQYSKRNCVLKTAAGSKT